MPAHWHTIHKAVQCQKVCRDQLPVLSGIQASHQAAECSQTQATGSALWTCPTTASSSGGRRLDLFRVDTHTVYTFIHKHMEHHIRKRYAPSFKLWGRIYNGTKFTWGKKALHPASKSYLILKVKLLSHLHNPSAVHGNCQERELLHNYQDHFVTQGNTYSHKHEELLWYVRTVKMG